MYVELESHFDLLKYTPDQQIHYIAIGCSLLTHSSYELKWDQEYPIFLRNLKNNHDIELNLVLIDPDLEDPPLCTCDMNKKKEDKFIFNGKYYRHDENNINVFCYRIAVGYDNLDSNTYYIKKWVEKYIDHCTKTDDLLFLQDYTNRNISSLSKLTYPPNKILIGFLDDDQNICRPDMSLPVNQPLILKDKKLSIWSIDDIHENTIHEQYINSCSLINFSNEAALLKSHVENYISKWITNFINYVVPIYRQLRLNIRTNNYSLKYLEIFNLTLDSTSLDINYFRDQVYNILYTLFVKIFGFDQTKNILIEQIINILDNDTRLYELGSIVKNEFTLQKLLA